MKRTARSLAGAAALLSLVAAGQAQASDSVPANYRQLVAQKLVATSNWKIHKIRVSRPYQEWAGAFYGGMRPSVCAEVYRDTLFGGGGRDLWLITFHDGRVDTANVMAGAIWTVNCKPEFAVEVPKGR